MFDQASLADHSDTQLILSARHGDQGAFCELVGRYRKKVVDFVYRMCGDQELAQEAAQDAFIRAWQNLHQYDPKRPLRNWLFRIATNAAIDHLRQVKPVDNIEKLALSIKEDNPEDILEANQKAEKIHQAVLNLPAASRSVLVLREYEGLTYQEISDTLQIPIGTVMSRLNFARNQLRQSLKPFMEAE